MKKRIVVGGALLALMFGAVFGVLTGNGSLAASSTSSVVQVAPVGADVVQPVSDILSPECALGECGGGGLNCSWGLGGGCECGCHDLESDLEVYEFWNT